MRKRPGNPETAVFVLGIRNFPGADCRAEVPWTNPPGPAPQDTLATISTYCPRGAVLWRPLIIIVPAILYPFPYISMHVVKDKHVSTKRSNTLSRNTTIVCVIKNYFITKTILRTGTRSRDVLPFSFAQQSICFARLQTRPPGRTPQPSWSKYL
jgi:hypothetical protein